MSPETILQVAEWREMLRSSVYRENTMKHIVFAHGENDSIFYLM